MVAKRVFLIHATEDKEGFVVPYATALRSKGVDIWLDKWEMRAGDSLVQKIFDEGLGSSEAVIVVLSAASVRKPWVRKELDHAVVKRIEEDVPLIPVVIDRCAVPEAVRSLVQIRLTDESDLADAVQETVDAICGTGDRPPLGPPPGYLNDEYEDRIPWPGILPADRSVLKVLCESAIDRGERNVNVSALTPRFEELDLSYNVVAESIQILLDESLIKSPVILVGKVHHVTVAVPAFDAYCIHSVPGYVEFKRVVAARLVNEGPTSNHALARDHGKSRLIAEQALQALAEDGFISVTHMSGNTILVTDIRPQLSRALKSESL